MDTKPSLRICSPSRVRGVRLGVHSSLKKGIQQHFSTYRTLWSHPKGAPIDSRPLASDQPRQNQGFRYPGVGAAAVRSYP